MNQFKKEIYNQMNVEMEKQNVQLREDVPFGYSLSLSEILKCGCSVHMTS